MKWTKYLDSDVEARLKQCCSLRSDIPLLVNAKWLSYKENGKDKQGFTKEDCLIQILELLESNSQDFELTREEYNELKA